MKPRLWPDSVPSPPCHCPLADYAPTRALCVVYRSVLKLFRCFDPTFPSLGSWLLLPHSQAPFLFQQPFCVHSVNTGHHKETVGPHRVGGWGLVHDCFWLLLQFIPEVAVDFRQKLQHFQKLSVTALGILRSLAWSQKSPPLDIYALVIILLIFVPLDIWERPCLFSELVTPMMPCFCNL